MNVLICAFAYLSLLGHSYLPIQVNVDAKTGDSISGERNFRVTVDSDTAINQVEFYVGDELRDTETSTPYLFPLDTVNEGDGDVKIRFKAYTVESKTAEKVLTIHIDNEKAKGADYHIKTGLDDLTENKFQDAMEQGRIAMKIDPQNGGARVLLARANLGLKVYDKAQKFAEDAVAADPKNDAALQVLAAIDVQRAFSTFAKGDSDRADALSSIGEAFKQAVEARKKSLDLEVDASGAPTDANLLKYADTALRAERYSLATEALQPVFNKDPKNKPVLDRLGYALVRSGRYQEALNDMETGKTEGGLDAYGDALLAVLYIQVGREQDSDNAIKAGIESDPDNLGVRTAQAFIALKKNRTAVLSGLVADLARDQSEKTSVAYFLMALANRQERFGDARRYFERAVLAEPAFPDLYIEQANYSIGLAIAPKVDPAEKDRDLSTAKLYYETALVARPEAADALAGLSLVDLMQKNVSDGVKYAEAARNAAKDEAMGHYALAAAYQAAGNLDGARTENDQAGKLDAPNLEGRSIPDPRAVWRYLIAGARVPVIAPPGS